MNNLTAYVKAGDRVQISGDSTDLWIQDYDVRVDTEATVMKTPEPYAKKVMVCLDCIDHETNVTTFVRRARCHKI